MVRWLYFVRQTIWYVKLRCDILILIVNLSCGVLPSRQRLLTGLYPRALPPVTHSSALQAPERMREACDEITLQAPERMRGTGDMDTHPLAYCPPGRGSSLVIYPRALPPVTHGSAFQAPECLRSLIRGRKEEPILRRTALQAEACWVIYPRALPPVTHGSALQAPERLWRPSPW